jgi:xylulokinase
VYLGIDIGTSSVKAVIMNADGDVIEQSTAPLGISRPKDLWSEQSPHEWWEKTSSAVCALAPDRRRRVRAIGLSGQMHGATLLGADLAPLRPAILWNDGRSFKECAELERAAPRSRQITGNLAMPGFTAPKLLWVRKNEPDVFARTTMILLPKDFVRLKMTGECASDMSDSAGTLWLDVGGRRWSQEMLTACGLDERAMPALYEGTHATGRLRRDVATSWGMEEVAVAAGGGDNAAGAVGVGVTEPGSALLSLGTSGVIFVADDQFRANPAAAAHAFCHALPDRWHQMSVMLSAASCLEWAARLTSSDDVAALAAAAEHRGRLDAPEIFLPYLSGERTPHNNPHARGVFFGLSNDTDKAALAQAIMEGVAFAFADGLDALRDGGSSITELSVIGGGARSAYWGRILSAALGMPLVFRRDAEVGPAHGAAKLAAICDGNEIAVVCAPAPVRATIEPNPGDFELLAAKRERFRALYPSLRALFS